jgi:nitrate/nitrite transport system substrate-binding protein
VSSSSSTRAVGNDPDRRKLRIGFIALSDCASIVMAQALGYFAERDVHVELVRQNSWAALRDNLLAGEIDCAHCLFSLPLSVATRIGGGGNDSLRIAMVLSNNGQGITLANNMSKLGYANVWRARSSGLNARTATFAATFPGGTHDTWLRYWLRASGLNERRLIVSISPSQMVENLKHGRMIGFCAGEPWNAIAVAEEAGFTHLATQDLWRHHPEKALVVHVRCLGQQREALQAAMGAILKASRWIEAGNNTALAAAALAERGYLGCPLAQIVARMEGRYQLGLGLEVRYYGEDRLRFFRGGLVNAPRRAHALWFLAQYRRFGLLDRDPPYEALVDRLIARDLYEQVAEREHIEVPNDDMRPFELTLDGALFDPKQIAAEVARP